MWKRLLKWLIPTAGGLVVGLAAAAWYLHRSLPPLRVTGYNPITHDNHGGWIGGTEEQGFTSITDSQELGGAGGERFGRGDRKGSAWGWAYVVLGCFPGWIESSCGFALEPNALWTVGVLGGPAHFITKVENTWDHRWSPDGKYIAYIDERKGQEGLYVMGRDGADERKLVTMKATH